jgi:hypothetical protein
MFQREYMDYHSDRFRDHSLMILAGEKLVGLVPANADSAGILYSHQGLSFGGLVLNPKASASDTVGMMNALTEYLQTRFQAAIMKTMPSIFCESFREDIHYALFRSGWHITRRDLSTVIDYAAGLPYRKTKRHAVRKAREFGLTLRDDVNTREVWSVIAEVLSSRHGVEPTHNASEISLLSAKFPENINCFCTEVDGSVVAVAIVFLNNSAVHTQYLAATPAGRKVGGLDFLLDCLISKYEKTCRWFSFGISTTDGGINLNDSLLFQKEGFGGRGVVHDFYQRTFS